MRKFSGAGVRFQDRSVKQAFTKPHGFHETSVSDSFFNLNRRAYGAERRERFTAAVVKLAEKLDVL